MRRSAERRLSMRGRPPGESGAILQPPSAADPGGHAQHAFALQAMERSAEARDAARKAWTGGVLPLPMSSG